MKKYIKVLIPCALFMASIYGLISFYSLSLNPKVWGEQARVVFCILSGFTIIIVMIFRHIDEITSLD